MTRVATGDRRPRMARELARKTIHVGSAVLPLGVWVAPRALAIAVLVPLALAAVVLDVARLRLRGPRYWFLRFLRPMFRHHERRAFTGATYMVAAYALAVVLFPKPVAVAAMLFNGLGDAAAALVGKRWGRHRTRWGKSWEGFAAGVAVNLAAGLAVAWLDPGLRALPAAIGAVAAAAVEFADLPVDDNLRVTLVGAAAIFIASLVV